MKARLFLTICAWFVVVQMAIAESQSDYDQASRPIDAGNPSGQPITSAQTNLKPQDAWSSPIDDEATHTFIISEILEYRWNEGADTANWDLYGWHGGDYNRLWFKSEGSAATQNSSGDGDFQLLYGRLISRYFDFQIGLRYEQLWDSNGTDRARGSAVIGFQGLAPYYFDLEPTLFVSQDGDVSGQLTATYDVLITQRLILQPRIEAVAAVQRNEDFGVGSGLNNIEAGLRIRYEIKREFAPYIGINYGKRFGETADLARDDGEDPSVWSLVSGVRFWF